MKTLSSWINHHYRKAIWVIFSFWLSLFLPIWSMLGTRQGTFNMYLLTVIFPNLGILALIAAAISRNSRLLLFEIALIFAFPLTMAFGYALFGH